MLFFDGPFESSYDQIYGDIYDWGILEFEDDGTETYLDDEDTDEDNGPEVLLPGSEEVAEA